MNSRYFIYCLLLLLAISCQQPKKQMTKEEHHKMVEQLRNEQFADFINPETSPLPDSLMDSFSGLDFYAVDFDYRVKAAYEPLSSPKTFEMPSSGDPLPVFEKVAEVHFQLTGKDLTLSAYQDVEMAQKEEHTDHLFIPFRDGTSGVSTYGGGRYLDLHIPEGDSLILDFNLAYNPYCAYNYMYSCPVPPEENNLDMDILAGEKNFQISQE